MNSIKLTGNLTKDPETFSPEGSESTCIKFTIGNNDESRKKSDGSEYEDIPSFVDVKYWTKNVQYWIQKLTKGVSVTVQGRLKQERWTDNDNNNHSRIVVMAEVGYNQGFAIVPHERAQSQSGTNSSSSSSSSKQDEEECPF